MEMNKFDVFASVRSGGTKTNRFHLLLFLVVALVVVIITAAVFLPVFAQEGAPVNCDTGANPYPYPGLYPSSQQNGYPYPGIGNRCAYLPMILEPGQ